VADQGLKYTISATDKSKSVLRGTLGELDKFRSKATSILMAPFRAMTSLKGLGLQTNIRLVQSMVGQLDSFIDRGARMDATQKSFVALTGRSEQASMRLARRLQEQSNGALTLARSMELANRGLSSGMSAGDIGTTFDFISKKAFTTGTRLESALEKVMTGLIRGSTLFLDDFGVLVDGVEQVRRDFDAIHGKNAFDQLTPAAQKAEIVRAAIADMNRQMSAFGVTGKESAFQWARIKSSLKGSLDYLAAAAVKSDAIRGILADASSLVTDIASGLEGKDAGKTLQMLAGGARKVLGAALTDAGRLLIKGAIEYVPKLLHGLFEAAKRFASYLGDLLKTVAQGLVASVKLLLDRTGLVGLTEEQRDEAKKRANAKLPGLPGFGDLGKWLGAGGGKPFAETTGAWADMVDRFKHSGFGKDDMEKQSGAARGNRTFYERRSLERERLGIDRELASLQRRGGGAYSVSEVRHGRDVFARDLQENPELARLSGKDRHARLTNILAEERAARMKQLQERKRLIGEEMVRANQPKAAGAVPMPAPKAIAIDLEAVGQKGGEVLGHWLDVIGNGLASMYKKLFPDRLMLMGAKGLPLEMKSEPAPTTQPAAMHSGSPGEIRAKKASEWPDPTFGIGDRIGAAMSALFGNFTPDFPQVTPPTSREDLMDRYGADAAHPRGGAGDQAIETAATASAESAEHLRVASETMLSSARASSRAAKELTQQVGMI